MTVFENVFVILLGFWDSRGLEVMTENVQYYAL